ncbi:hypothetical protein PthstB1num2_35200 [Parageobacillus thermoglucosidasius]|nr:hypothetical protein PthstB1num2_35200 [Parageobacillus thermoglucosidasius]
MFVQLRKITVTEGNAEKVVEQFGKPGIIEQQEGFVDIKIMVKKQRGGKEEVIVLVTWESEEHGSGGKKAMRILPPTEQSATSRNQNTCLMLK